MIEDMEKTEKDLYNKNLTYETIKRQKQIEIRMLEAEKAEQQQETDNLRKSETAKNDYNSNLIKNFQYNVIKNNNFESMNRNNLNFNLYYRKKFKNILIMLIMRKIDPLYIKNNDFIAVLDDYLNRFFQQNNLPDEIYENIYLAVYETLKLIISKFNNLSNSNALKLELSYDNGNLCCQISCNHLIDIWANIENNYNDEVIESSLVLINKLSNSLKLLSDNSVEIMFDVIKMQNEFEQIKNDEFKEYKILKN